MLKDALIVGIQTEWDENPQAFVESGRIGPAQAEELVSIHFKGWREVMSGPNKGKFYPDLRVQRRSSSTRPKPNDGHGGGLDGDIPF